jgi:RNA polymerase sigma-70 factor (ECF subfamily)
MAQPDAMVPAVNGRLKDRPAPPASSLMREELPLAEPDPRPRFEATFLPHLAAAYNLARWLTRDRHDAEDVVQEAYLRALRSYGSFQGGDGRAWFLAIVRNTCLTWFKRNRPPQPIVRFDESVHDSPADTPGPDRRLIESARRDALHQALEDLPVEFREAVVLRELEELSYKEIATVTGVPIGTVMSRLARGRSLLREQMSNRRPDDI